MRINRFSYHNKATGWRLEPTEFGDFNLLVGASGVGKTRILEAVQDLRHIAKGGVRNGVKWDVEFNVADKCHRWCGEYEASNVDETLPDYAYDAKLCMEELWVEQTRAYSRDLTQITVNGTTLPIRLSSSRSILSLLDDEAIISVRQGFEDIVLFDQSVESRQLILSQLSWLGYKTKLNNLEKIQQHRGHILLKLLLAQEHKLPVFGEIIETFCDVFPFVDNVRFVVRPIEYYDDDLDEPTTMVHLESLENGAWVTLSSSGMLKTLMLAASIYLWPPGTIILIDEFENGLGANCIDVLDDLPYENRGLQFIVTSHHPYIINNIPMGDWKIVTRQGNRVTVHNHSEFDRLNERKLDPFVQLTNLAQYNKGITTA